MLFVSHITPSKWRLRLIFGTFKLGHYTFVFKINYYAAELIGASEDR